ncbi:MGDG synthase family glycosyltransferase [Planococcus ruber]|uniref:MGDG synthase family glycosyltransferase n=1 Tax=Planococcus ruber TaxID=2027871 RepID=UPI001FEEEE62|nr:glycosyltransferase [Planococcus ruber]MCJ1907986.1 galactosyldiacylglycerol synthase [Planococcus ruber]
MKKVLIFPLLNSMPSGHHQVAEAMSEFIRDHTGEVECKKVDLLSEWNAKVESVTVKAYLNWIRRAPNSYAWIYRQFAYKSSKEKSHKTYEWLFMKKVSEILEREKPDLIICTHGFPSLFINKLKKQGKCKVPCLNVYTDFFVNDVWGRECIEYHFAPNEAIKGALCQRYGIPENRIFVTGIPVSEKFSRQEERHSTKRLTVLVSGGSTGLSEVLNQLDEEVNEEKWNFQVLCGTNKKLQQKIIALNHPAIHAIPYISSKEMMNELYSKADALVTKPGGVTVSEALRKELPIFIPAALPGQEEINLAYLLEEKLVFAVPEGRRLMDFLDETLADEEAIGRFQKRIKAYKNSLSLKNSDEIYMELEKILVGN